MQFFQTLTELFLRLEFSYIALSLGLITLLVTAVALRRMRLQQQQLKSKLASIENDMRALTTAALTMGQRVLETERKQQNFKLAQKQTQPAVQMVDSANQPYEHAIRMVQKGASIQQLVDVCGLSTNEAELIHMMHRFDQKVA